MIRIDAHWCFGASSIPSSIVTSSSTYSSTYSSTPIAYVGLSHFAYPRSGTSTMRDLEQRLPVQCHIPRQFSSDSSDSSVTGLLDIDHIWSSRISSQTEHRHQAVCSESFLFAGSLWLTPRFMVDFQKHILILLYYDCSWLLPSLTKPTCRSLEHSLCTLKRKCMSIFKQCSCSGESYSAPLGSQLWCHGGCCFQPAECAGW